jgi:hypothetical protein
LIPLDGPIPAKDFFSIGSGTRYYDVYPLFHTASVYEGFRRDFGPVVSETPFIENYALNGSAPKASLLSTSTVTIATTRQTVATAAPATGSLR